ncbi:hypothetical protein PoB_006045500 [Plakobranchus ocellatus]|uniref:HNH endonuclease n=1 Tax=Plakobranchus ocellatus TaxID=259542 RepID=A0AAV4CQ34_9GAST|nr:hypothetical protein PoB_006045500 [Plakobranchus ocellatus]
MCDECRGITKVCWSSTKSTRKQRPKRSTGLQCSADTRRQARKATNLYADNWRMPPHADWPRKSQVICEHANSDLTPGCLPDCHRINGR